MSDQGGANSDNENENKNANNGNNNNNNNNNNKKGGGVNNNKNSGIGNNDKNGGIGNNNNKNSGIGNNNKSGRIGNNNENVGNANNNKAAEVPQPHAIMEQLPSVQFCINSPPPWIESLILGFQHYMLSLGTTVLIPSMIVPLMGGGQGEKVRVIQTLLFVSGVNTLLQSFFGTRLPSVIGGSYAYLVPILSIIKASRYASLDDPAVRFAMTMRGVQGALIVASSVQMVIGFLAIWRNILRFVFPLQMVPLISLGGLGLYYLGFPLLARCAEIGVPGLIIVVVISQHLQACRKLKRICDRYPVLLTTVVVWFYAGILTWGGAYKSSPDGSCRIDRVGLIGEAPWFYFPLPYQWGPPTVDVGEAVAMSIAAIVASTESTGAFLVAARYGKATPVPPYVIGRGIGWMGFSTLLSGLLGGITGSTASMENAGLLAMTKAGSRRVVQISAAFMIMFSMLGKFGAFFASVPLSIMGGIYCVCLGYSSAAGLGFLQHCNLNNLRTESILGISFFLGLSIPQYFRDHQIISGTGPVHTKAIWFNDVMSVIFMSNAMVAVTVALILEWTLPRDGEQTRKDNGSHWWGRFLEYNKDVRSDEFYKLPFGLNKYFPPV